MNFLDRNEFNFEPSQKVVEAIKNFDPKTLCFYTRIYDQGKKSVISVRLSEIYGVPEEQVLLHLPDLQLGLRHDVHTPLLRQDSLHMEPLLHVSYSAPSLGARILLPSGAVL